MPRCASRFPEGLAAIVERCLEKEPEGSLSIRNGLARRHFGSCSSGSDESAAVQQSAFRTIRDGRVRPRRRTQEIKFCTTADGVSLAYSAVGAGPFIVRVLGHFTHLEMEWEWPDLRRFWEHLAERLHRRSLRRPGNGSVRSLHRRIHRRDAAAGSRGGAHGCRRHEDGVARDIRGRMDSGDLRDSTSRTGHASHSLRRVYSRRAGAAGLRPGGRPGPVDADSQGLGTRHASVPSGLYQPVLSQRRRPGIDRPLQRAAARLGRLPRQPPGITSHRHRRGDGRELFRQRQRFLRSSFTPGTIWPSAPTRAVSWRRSFLARNWCCSRAARTISRRTRR